MNQREAKLTPEWEEWARRGRFRGPRKRAAAVESRREDGDIRGFYSDLPLDPSADPTDSLYPSLDHVTHPKDHSQMVVETRIVNDMKSHLSEEEFWKLIEHLYCVGVQTKKILSGAPKRCLNWTPARHFKK